MDAPPIFHYICSGDFDEVVLSISVEDVTSKTRYYIDQART